MTSVCVYCGSSVGNDPVYSEAAETLGDIMLRQELTLVYGGGSIGLMGILSRKVYEGGGKVIGIIPDFLNELEVGSDDVTEKHLVRTMHERKAMMIAKSDAFIALPGGIGTLDETAEVITWAQLGLHNKPIWLFGPGDYWQPLIRLLDHMEDHGFVRPDLKGLFEIVETLPQLETKLQKLS